MSKKIIAALLTTVLLWSCKPAQEASAKINEVGVSIDLNNVWEDKVMVTVTAPPIETQETIYSVPKIIPGTYMVDNYGKLIADFRAYDKDGKELMCSKKDENSWRIPNANTLAKITYWVNDTYDSETGSGFGKDQIFSPAGTNISQGKNFMINNHGFVGYFTDKKELTYKLTVLHPDTLFGATSMVDTDPSAGSDLFVASRYNELVDNPIMYAKPDYTTFRVDDMEILFSVYSPNGKHSAKSLSPDLEKMMRAQKTFLGAVNANKKYTVLLYLSDMTKRDATGFGALEHNTSTSVVFPEMMPAGVLGQQIIDVVSHEFFHIVTPLGVHSNEIHNFDFNSPKMSQHLWMYEGVTEYFANLFQINQGLITEAEFYQRMAGKIENASAMNDTMPFTVMSQNVLSEPYKSQYLNVYEKGALIGMCIDIIIREKSNGQRGILDLMQKLTNEFGPKRPFNDAELFGRITELTYPEVGEFLNKYVAGETPIPYDVYFAKTGVSKAKGKIAGNPFVNGENQTLTADATTKEIKIADVELTDFLKSMGFKANDAIVGFNGKDYTLENAYELITDISGWKEGDTITAKIKRDGKVLTLSGKYVVSYVEADGYTATDSSKDKLKQAWLKG